jgi:hypothetical protein
MCLRQCPAVYVYVVRSSRRQILEFLQIISCRVANPATHTKTGREAPAIWVLCLSNE